MGGGKSYLICNVSIYGQQSQRGTFLPSPSTPTDTCLNMNIIGDMHLQLGHHLEDLFAAGNDFAI